MIEEDKRKTDAHWDFIVKWLESNSAEAPLLLSGSQKDYVSAVIDKIVKLVICESGGVEACGTCKKCVQKSTGQGEEVLYVSTDKPTISIRQIREMLKSLTLTAWRDKRVVVIEDAHKLSLQASNSMLKALEESTLSTRYVLVTKYPLRMLNTIKSRCQHIHIRNEMPVSRINEEAPVKNNIMQLLNGAGNITDEDIDRFSLMLEEKLRSEGPSQKLKVAAMRLRDYYQIKSVRGNEKLAKEVLLASLPD
jgi:DNA polymerase III delta prime subunit